MLAFVIDFNNLDHVAINTKGNHEMDKPGESVGEEARTEDVKKGIFPRRERTQIMTPKEAAKYLGFHLVTIYRLLKKREVPAVKIGGQWRFKKDVLDAWLVERMGKG